MNLEMIDEDVVKRLAKIFGATSAAQRVLDEADRRRERGEAVAFYRGTGKHNRVLIVADPPESFGDAK